MITNQCPRPHDRFLWRNSRERGSSTLAAHGFQYHAPLVCSKDEDMLSLWSNAPLFLPFLKGGDMDMPACFQQSQLMTSTAWLTCGSAKEFKGRREDSGSAARLPHSQLHAGAY